MIWGKRRVASKNGTSFVRITPRKVFKLGTLFCHRSFVQIGNMCTTFIFNLDYLWKQFQLFNLAIFGKFILHRVPFCLDSPPTVFKLGTFSFPRTFNYVHIFELCLWILTFLISKKRPPVELFWAAYKSEHITSNNFVQYDDIMCRPKGYF